MTVAEAIKQWLYKNGTIEIDEKINTEILGNELGALSLSKMPDNVIIHFIGGSELRTEYYMFFVRKAVQIEHDRISNDEFLENLENWVWQKNKERDYPVIDEKRICQGVAVSSSYYLFESDEEKGIYTLTIEIKYRKEK